MRKTILLAAVMLLLVETLAGCTAITDFDDDWINEDGDDELYPLDDFLTNPIYVDLLGNGNAIISLDMYPPIPEVEDGGDSAILAMLGDIINMAVRNDTSGVSVNLIEGTSVNATPMNPGEYQMTLSPDRTSIEVIFRNEVDGKSLREGGEYTALISVLPNDVFLYTPQFTRDVVVRN
ncbi:MAG: hypothetical protein QNJ97_05355 [Myxococcota bacterium]|nr:hypothetical protein [Myxococcota bacterium]